MTNLKNAILIFLLLAFSNISSFSQISNFHSVSDSLLFEKDLPGSLRLIELGGSLEINTHESIALRKRYLKIILDYQQNYQESFFEKAKAALDSILIDDSISKHSKTVYLHHFMSSFSRKLLQNIERIKYCDEGLTLSQSLEREDTMFTIKFLIEKGAAKSDEEQYKDALVDLQLAEELCNNHTERDSNDLATIFYFLGTCNKTLEESSINKGYRYLLLAEQTFLALANPDTSFLAATYGMLSDISWRYGDYEKGLNYVKKYKDLTNQIDLSLTKDPLEQIQLKYHLYYKEMQFYQTHQVTEALALLEESEKDFHLFHDNDEIKLRMAAIYNMMGELYVAKFPAKAAPFYLKAIKTLNYKYSAYHLQYLFNLGKSTLYGGDPLGSLEYSSELIALANNDNGNLPHFYFLHAFAYIKLGNFDKALEITNQVLNQMDPKSEIDLIHHSNLKHFSPPNAYMTNVGLLARMGLEFIQGFPQDTVGLKVANALFQLGIAEFGKSIKAAKATAYTNSTYEELMWGILATKEFLKDGDLSLSEIVEFSENTNEKYLWTTHKANSDPNLFFSPELLEKEKVLRSKLIDLKQQAIANRTDEISQLIFDVNLQLEKIENEKRKSNSSYYDFEKAIFEIESFQAKLSPGVLVLKYEFIKDSLYLFEITCFETKITNLQTDSLFLSKIKETYHLISNPQSNQDTLSGILTELGDLLLPAFSSDITDLVIKADGKLNLIPFDLLIRNGKFLLEEYTVGYINALGLYENNLNRQTVHRALIVSPSYIHPITPVDVMAVRGDAYDLSGALEEGRILAEMLPGNALFEENGLKSIFVSSSEKYDLLHFSMHAFINDDDPELSNLVFHDGENDNKLYISELYGMKLNAHMAVLSACNTAIGKEDTGGGIVSLNRAFTFSGVSSVVSSLWNAPDQATKEIMVKFYENLNEGLTKPDALKKAKLAYLNNQKINSFKHPYFWAGFVMYGNPSSLKIVKNQINPTYYIIVFAFVLALIVVLIYWRNNDLARKK